MLCRQEFKYGENKLDLHACGNKGLSQENIYVPKFPNPPHPYLYHRIGEHGTLCHVPFINLGNIGPLGT